MSTNSTVNVNRLMMKPGANHGLMEALSPVVKAHIEFQMTVILLEYGIPTYDETRWYQLAKALAYDYHPSFKTAREKDQQHTQEEERKRGERRKQIADAVLYLDVQAKLTENRGESEANLPQRTEKWAAYQVAKLDRWKSLNKETVYRYYKRAKKHGTAEDINWLVDHYQSLRDEGKESRWEELARILLSLDPSGG